MRTVLVGKKLYENKELETVRLHQGVAEEAYQTTTAGDPLPVAFLAALSEELRTPLNLIIAYSKMMKEGLLGTINPKQDKALQQVLKSTYWVLMMLNGLLQSSGAPDKAAPLPVADDLVSRVFSVTTAN